MSDQKKPETNKTATSMARQCPKCKGWLEVMSRDICLYCYENEQIEKLERLITETEVEDE